MNRPPQHAQLLKVKELDEEYDKVTCVTWHHGANEPMGTMNVPPPPTAQAAPPGSGPR